MYSDRLFILKLFSFKETFLNVTIGRGFFPLAKDVVSFPLVREDSFPLVKDVVRTPCLSH